MPVDLNSIPALAQRSLPPSSKRWLFFLAVLLIICGTATLYFWPADAPTRTPTFWYCFILVPFLVWLVLFGLRWLVHTFSDCVNDGWDEEREWTLNHEVLRGQRYANVLAHVVHLPHAMSSASLSMQMVAQEITLPSTSHDVSHEVIRQARFDDITSPATERLQYRIGAILADNTLAAALSKNSIPGHLNVFLQVDIDRQSDNIDLPSLWERALQQEPLPCTTSLVPGGGLEAFDRWLDKSIAGQTLLIVAVRLAGKEKDGEGDAAVALLLQTPMSGKASSDAVACIHRPERCKVKAPLADAVLQSLHWGDTRPESVEQVWLTGMGCDNQAQSVFSQINVAFTALVTPEQTCDIDIYTGLTGEASPWLSLALATDNAAIQHCTQFVMSAPQPDVSLPWFTVVHPAQNRAIA